MERIKTILSRVKLFCELECAMVDKIEEYERRIYALEQDNKRNTALLRELNSKVLELTMVVTKQR